MMRASAWLPSFSSASPWFLFLLLLIFCAWAPSAIAEDLEVRLLDGAAGADRARVEVAWRNAWHNERNHDGVWVFFKHAGGHLRLAGDGHAVDVADGVSAQALASADGSGVWLFPNRAHRGDVRIVLTARFAPGSAAGGDVRAYGIEMVRIPAGPYWLGDAGVAARAFGGVHLVGAETPGAMLWVGSEAPIAVGTAPGELTYAPGNGGYAGDVGGPVPASFPKGTEAFWVMKYELSQGQYVDFLNDLPDGSVDHTTGFRDAGYAENRGSIRQQDGRWVADAPARPANYLRWDDQLAFTDWAALRPFTELEFTKASRGPREPVVGEFPWGTASREELLRLVTADDATTQSDGSDESALSNDTLDRFGASYYWVLDLAGSVWERVITFGSADGRAFTGTHGDGNLDAEGRATNDDWPHEYAGRNGHGYRGGGFYGHDVEWHEFNPYSPVSYRRFGGWAGHDPHRAYGYRAARSAER